MDENAAECNGARSVLRSERIVFTDAEDAELFSADLVKLAMDLEQLREQRSAKYAEYIEAVRRAMAAEYKVEEPTTSQAWCLVECVRVAWNAFKKKFDAELMLLTTTDSTPSPSTTERSAITPQSCPES
jgi:hypothetical protein